MATTKATTLAHTLGGISSDISTAEINRLDGLTGDIQTLLNLKAPLASPTFTGTITAPNDSISGDAVSGGTIGAGTFDGTLGSSVSFPSGMLQGKSKNHVAAGTITVAGGATVISSNLDLTLPDCTSGSTFICGFNSPMYYNGHTSDLELDIVTNIEGAGGSGVVYPNDSPPSYGSMGAQRVNTDWTHRSQMVVLDSLGHSTGNDVRFRMRYRNTNSSTSTTICHNAAMLSFYVLEIK